MKRKLNLFSILVTLALTVIVATSVMSELRKQSEGQTLAVANEIMVDECVEEFGIDVGGMHVVKGKLDRNQFLADILLPYGMEYPAIDKLVKKAKPIFDVRKLNVGNPYTLICKDDSAQTAQFFIYEKSALEFVVFDLRDTFDIYEGSRPVTLVEKEAGGIISSSLYQTLIDQKLSPALAMELAEIYAWTIDFYRIQKDDYFKVVYDEKQVEDKTVGVGTIKAALFHHSGEPLYAIQFKQGEVSDYFDLEGMSMRKAFLQAPLKFSRISSGFSNRRFHPVQKRWKAHLGTDYAAPKGTPIMAVGDGTITEARYKKFNGNYVKIKHNGTYSTQYLHMSKIASGISPGKYVKQGDIIGYVGSTGLATGPHVCFRFWKHGQQVDHRREKIPPSDPIQEAYRLQYEPHADSMKQRLHAIPLGAVDLQLSTAQL